MARQVSMRSLAAIAVAATAVTGTAVAFAWPSGRSAQPSFAGTELTPVTSEVRTVDLDSGTDPRRKVELPARDTQRFSTVGITWTDPAAALRGTAQIRTRAVAGRAWSPWLSLDMAEAGADNPQDLVAGRVRGATEPQWVGVSDGVEVRVVAASGTVTDALPAGLRLELVDPGSPTGGTGGGSTGGGGSGGQGGGGQGSGGQGGGGQGGGAAAPGDPEPTVPEPTVPGPGAPEPTAPEPTAAEPTAEPTATGPGDPAPTTDPTPTTPQGSATDTPPTTTQSPSPSGSVSPSASTSVSPSASVPPRPSELRMPPVVSRLQWRADEKINRDKPAYGTTIKGVFVHHTADRTTYDCANSPAIIRGIHAYHVKSRGWSDIGYNFLVDKCGTLFEGRKGGVESPVVGAHTYGFNTNNLGVAVIGTYSSAGVPAKVRSVLANLAAYRLGRYGNDPAGTVQQTSGVQGRFTKGQTVTMKRISGHRDADFTECPGTALYGQLASIRDEAAQWIGGLTAKPLTGGVLSAGTYYARGAVTLSWALDPRSALPARFEVLVDGRVAATTAATGRSASVRLASGRHTVAVRAVHTGGRVATSAPQSVVSDTTAPTFPGRPELSLRTGTVSTSAVPVTLGWRAADNGRLASVTASAPSTRAFGTTTGSWAATATPGRATAWRLRAADVVGNASTAAVTRTPVLLAETSAKKSGRWTSTRNAGHLGGRALAGSAKKASLTWTFTGRSAALVVGRTAKSGKADVYVDGRRVATIDLKAGRNAYRQAMWTRSWSTSGRHTVKVVVLGTAKRPAVTLDGLAYVR